MIAEKFGYWVSAVPAAKVAETPAAIEQSTKTDAEDRRVKYFGVAVGVFFIGLVLTGLTRSPVFIILGSAAGLIITVVPFVDQAPSPPDFGPVESLLKRQPWQAWPCRVDGIGGNPDSRKKVVYLMSPDQQVVKAFEAVMPHTVWRDLTDGMGVLWVCGDLRYPVAMASVRGGNVWLAKPARRSVVAPIATAVFMDVVSSASSEAVKGLLEP